MGFASTLLDFSFNHTITTKLIRAVYVFAMLIFISQCVFMLLIGFWVLSWRTGWAWGGFMILGAPVLLLFEITAVRLILEFVINQFKITEYQFEITEHLKALRNAVAPAEKRADTADR
ncbi:MAG TPA: DUF4282 domain-containing protein [Kribbella sp.]|jgi:hypothetical protein